MKNYLGSLALEQENIRLALWKIFKEENHTVASLSRELGVNPPTLHAFFRGSNIRTKVQLRLEIWLKWKGVKIQQETKYQSR